MNRVPPSWQPTIEFAACVFLSVVLMFSTAERIEDKAYRTNAQHWVDGLHSHIDAAKREIIDSLPSHPGTGGDDR